MRQVAVGSSITIPTVLIEKLKPFGPRYIKVAPPILGNIHSGKAAVEREWQLHPYTAEEIEDWLRKGGNYGVLAGEGIVIVETDTEEATEKMAAIDTFTVQSGGGGYKRHFYIISNAAENGVIIDPTQPIEKRNIGNIQVERKFVVGPGCRHFTGNVYKIDNDAPIAYVSKQKLEKIFGDTLIWAHQQRLEHEEQAKEEKIEGALIPLKDLINLSELQARGDEYQGSHPIHGSLTGKNFCVNIKKNVWHCFRCNSGGGGLMWIAVKHGLIECHQAQKGALKGAKFLEALQIAKEKGFDVKVPDEELSPDVARFFERNKFVPALVADELMKEIRFLTQTEKGLMFRYNPDNGIYEKDAKDYVNWQVRKKLGKHYTINREREVKAFIKASTLQDIPETSKELIAVKNGVLNVFTRELKPFSPDFYAFNALPVTYDPNAESPLFDKFLPEVVPSEDDRKMLQESAGYCLLKDNRFQKALMLTGIKQNGKSTFLYTLTMMLGKENVSAVPLQILSDSNRPFTVAQIYGKLANICADLPAVSLKETDLFKKAVAGDMLTGEFKFQAMFEFFPYAKLFFSANLLPQLPKDVEAFIIRWNVVNFPNQFLPGDPRRDPDLKQKLTTPEELSGVLNWALDGLQRLLKQNGFTKGGTTEETEERWRMLTDTQKAFVEKHLIAELKDFLHPEIEIEIEKEKLYGAYVKFCADYNLPAVTRRNFSRLLPEYIQCGSRETTRMANGVKVHVYLWTGVRFKRAEEAEE
jgi:P4 family phage/plasmid primase-like protien